MRTVWKFPLIDRSGQAKSRDLEAMIVEVEMPRFARILSVQFQDRVPTLWALVDTLRPKCVRRFIVLATGSEVCESLVVEATFLGTIQRPGNGLVFHVFDDGELRQKAP